MPRRSTFAILAVALLALGGWALAQQKRPAEKHAEPAGGPFTVTHADGPTILLLDTKTGKTWQLSSFPRFELTWLPIERIDSPERAGRWLKEQEKIRRAQEGQEEDWWEKAEEENRRAWEEQKNRSQGVPPMNQER